MNVIQRRRLRRLTQGVYASSLTQSLSQASELGVKKTRRTLRKQLEIDPIASQRQVIRFLPRGRVVMAISVILVALTLTSIAWKIWNVPVLEVPRPVVKAQTPPGAGLPTAPSEDASTANRNGQRTNGKKVWVHVTGAVNRPGVVELPADARVAQAITAAGGANGQANLEGVNMARLVQDGEQIRLPIAGETMSVAPSGGSGSGQGAGKCISLNSADATGLDSLPGIGPALASRIMDYRQKNGGFAAVSQLVEVPGIGPALLEKIKSQVCL